jgi:hypothetical protein
VRVRGVRVSDADIERGLREKAVTDPRAAEILIRWLQRLRPVAVDDSVEVLSVEQLESLHAGLVRLSCIPPEDLGVLVRACLDGRI